VSEPIEAVLFDYGHTLIYFEERPHSALVGAYENVNRLLAETLEREVPAAQILIERVSQVVDDEIQRDYAAGGLGLELEPDLIERVMELEQEGWLNSVHVGPHVVETLQTLRGRSLRLGLVSNAAYRPRLMTQQLRALGLLPYFDGVTFSSEVGVRKPHPEIFNDALRKVGVGARQALFVGDRVREDVLGPQRLGMRAILTREWRQEDDPGAADAVIEGLGELPAVVERLIAGPQAADTYNEVTSRE